MSNQPYPPNQPAGQVPYQEPVYGSNDDNTIRSSDIGSAHAQSQHEAYVDSAGNRVEQHAEVFEDKNQKRANERYIVRNVIYFILGVLEIILLLRLVFRLLGANESSSFVAFLYNFSHIFVVAFNGIFNDQTVGSSTFEFSTVIAMIVYALIAWGIVALSRVVLAPDLSGNQSITTTRRSRMR